MATIVKVITKEHFDKSLGLPFYQTEGASGADIKASLPFFLRENGLVITAGKRVLVPTGLCFEIPIGYEIQVRPRSGLSLKTSLLVVNSPGTIDCDYRGEVQIVLGNFGKEDYVVQHGLRLAQLVYAVSIQAKFEFSQGELTSTKRGSGGFGSTGFDK